MFDRKAKYIIWDDGLNDCVMIFSNHLAHANIAMALNITPDSAGFVEFVDQNGKITAIVSGESVSLKLSSRPEDSRLIERDFEFNKK
jgi:hypothetical protein